MVENGRDEIHLETEGTFSGPFGKVVEMIWKTAGAENVWDEPFNVPYEPDPTPYEKLCLSVENKQRRMIEQFGEEFYMSYLRDLMIYEDDEAIEDQIAYLKDVRFDEKDLGRTRSIKKKFLQQKLDERRYYDRDYD